ncbi:MAG: hypothetical protein GC160_00275 [Acidobacteria bacterium]|nr:hypothetical protein [Acidobacteriota bacterium]
MKINQKLTLPGGVDAELKQPSTKTDARKGGSFRDALDTSAIEPLSGSVKAPADPTPTASQQPAPRTAVGDRADVPDSWKTPNGPYHQAPEEYGGGWWYVNPFTGQEPWKRAEAANNIATGGAGGTGATTGGAAQLPDGFVDVFGEKPVSTQYKNYREYQTAKIRWEQDLKYFKQAGTPPDVSPEKLAQITKTTEAWGMGEPKFYEGRYGWKVRFPDSAFPDYEVGLEGVTMGVHQSIARYQIKMVQHGMEPAQKHPFVPPQVWLQLQSGE